MLLRFLVSERSIEANLEKVIAITNMRPIWDLKDVERVMGCLASLSRFMSCPEERGLPLYKLLRKIDHFKWSVEVEEALNDLKNVLTRTTILVSLEYKEPLLLYVAGTTQVVSFSALSIS